MRSLGWKAGHDGSRKQAMRRTDRLREAKKQLQWEEVAEWESQKDGLNRDARGQIAEMQQFWVKGSFKVCPGEWVVEIEQRLSP